MAGVGWGGEAAMGKADTRCTAPEVGLGLGLGDGQVHVVAVVHRFVQVDGIIGVIACV